MLKVSQAAESSREGREPLLATKTLVIGPFETDGVEGYHQRLEKLVVFVSLCSMHDWLILTDTFLRSQPWFLYKVCKAKARNWSLGWSSSRLHAGFVSVCSFILEDKSSTLHM